MTTDKDTHLISSLHALHHFISRHPFCQPKGLHCWSCGTNFAYLCILFLYLFIKALQHKCWRSVRHQVLQPAKNVEFKTVCLKSCRQEKKSMMHQDSLKPAAIQFTLERLQESARRSEYIFSLLFFMHLYSQEP